MGKVSTPRSQSQEIVKRTNSNIGCLVLTVLHVLLYYTSCENMLLEYQCMIPRSNVTSDFFDELTLFSNPAKLLREVKREVVWAHSTHLHDKYMLREVSAGNWGTERGTS